MEQGDTFEHRKYGVPSGTISGIVERSVPVASTSTLVSGVRWGFMLEIPEISLVLVDLLNAVLVTT